MAPLAARSVDPRQPPAEAPPTTTLPGAEEKPAETYDERWKRRWSALDGEDYETARALARDCLGHDPADADCHHVLTQSFTRKGDYGAELDQALDDCLGLRPEDAECLEGKILAEIHAAQRAAGLGDLAERRCLAVLPDPSACAETSTLADVRAARLASAKRWLARREALTDQPPDYIGRAMIAEAEGNLDAACEAYRGACRFEQTFACAMVEKQCDPRHQARARKRTAPRH